MGTCGRSGNRPLVGSEASGPPRISAERRGEVGAESVFLPFRDTNEEDLVVEVKGRRLFDLDRHRLAELSGMFVLGIISGNWDGPGMGSSKFCPGGAWNHRPDGQRGLTTIAAVLQAVVEPPQGDGISEATSPRSTTPRADYQSLWHPGGEEVPLSHRRLLQ